MQPRGGLIQNIKSQTLLTLTQFKGQFNALSFTPGERGRGLSELQITQPNRIERGDPAAAAEAGEPELVGRRELLQELAGVLGLKIETEPAKPAAGAKGNPAADDAESQAQIEARLAAKAAKNFQEADRIRDALKAQGIELIDKPGGLTDWIRG